MTSLADLQHLSIEQLRALNVELLERVAHQEKVMAEQDAVLGERDETIRRHEVLNEKLSYELAVLRRHRFGRRSESISPDQGSLLDELIDADIAAIEVELEQQALALNPAIEKKRQPKRTALPAELPRTIITHEPEHTHCDCGCALRRVGEDISEKLDYTPGEFTVERHIRGKWACDECDTLTQAPVPPHVIDKGIPTTGLLAHVLVAKFADHLPLYRQERIFERAGHAISRSTLADWVGRCGVELQPLVDALHKALLEEDVLHGDETPVPMLAPGKKKTHQAYVWAFASTHASSLQGVVYEFKESRAGKHARAFLQGWQGKLVCDDFSGYKAGFEQGITEVACWAHARRKFYDLLDSNKSQIAEQAVNYIGQLYQIEAECKSLTTEERLQVRQSHAAPIIDALYQWLVAQRQRVPKGSPISKAIHYSLNRWDALVRYLDDGALPIDNNWVENQIRPWALGRNNWLFAGSLRGGQRAAAVMSLIQSARINGHDPYAYLRDVLQRLPTQKASAINELLPHNWTADCNG